MGYVSLQEGNFELLHVIFYEALQPPPKKNGDSQVFGETKPLFFHHHPEGGPILFCY